MKLQKRVLFLLLCICMCSVHIPVQAEDMSTIETEVENVVTADESEEETEFRIINDAAEAEELDINEYDAKYHDAIILNKEFIGTSYDFGKTITIPFTLYTFGNSNERYNVRIYNERKKLIGSTDGYFPNKVGTTQLNVTWEPKCEPGKYYVRFFATYSSSTDDYLYEFYINDDPTQHFMCVKDEEQNAVSSNLDNPLSAWKYTNGIYSSYQGQRPYCIRLEELYVGDLAAAVVHDENSYNDEPASNQQWILMKFYLKNNSDSQFSASDIVNRNSFYSSDGVQLSVSDTCTFSGKRNGQGIYDLTLPGGIAGYFWYGVLVEKTEGYPLISIQNGLNSSNNSKVLSWLDLNPQIENEELDPVAAFVKRLYSLVLERNADPDGLASWKNALVNRESSGVDIGYGFVFSPECRERGLSNEAFVEMLYNTFMNRPSDDAGRNAWVKQLDAGVDREKIFEGFVYSQEFKGICEEYGIEVGSIENVEALKEVLQYYRNQNANITQFVARCYIEALSRNFDTEGLESWCRAIIEGENTPTEVAQNFIFSEEFTGKNLSNKDFVEVLYRTFMGREADEAGLAGWVAVLESGEEDREQILMGFANSDEFKEILQSFDLN